MRKNAQLNVRLSPAEQERARQLAALSGITVGELMRRLVADARVVVRGPLLEVDAENGENGAVRQDNDTVFAL